MEQFKGTSGKWEFEKDPDYPIHGIWSKDQFPTYIARTCYAGASLENAQLIAAAPELLAALKECINAMEYGDPKEETTSLAWNRVIFNGRKAINKALNNNV